MKYRAYTPNKILITYEKIPFETLEKASFIVDPYAE
jgi:hypothetical protein